MKPADFLLFLSYPLIFVSFRLEKTAVRWDVKSQWHFFFKDCRNGLCVHIAYCILLLNELHWKEWYKSSPHPYPSKQVAVYRTYSKASLGCNVYRYKHNLRELRKKKWEGVVRSNGCRVCQILYLYSSDPTHSLSVFLCTGQRLSSIGHH